MPTTATNPNNDLTPDEVLDLIGVALNRHIPEGDWEVAARKRAARRALAAMPGPLTHNCYVREEEGWVNLFHPSYHLSPSKEEDECPF